MHDVEVFTDMSVLSLANIKKATEVDPDFFTLKQYINEGFPENKAGCLESLRDYFNFREELAIIDGPDPKRTSLCHTQLSSRQSIRTTTSLSYGNCQNQKTEPEQAPFGLI